jgi:hypothetical protein
MKNQVNLELKAELIRRFGSQIEAALQMGIREDRLSYIVRGHTQPSKRERVALERSLGQTTLSKLLGENAGKKQPGADNAVEQESQSR